MAKPITLKIENTRLDEMTLGKYEPKPRHKIRSHTPDSQRRIDNNLALRKKKKKAARIARRNNRK